MIEKRQVVGLVANGSSGPWDFAVDETITQTARWFAHVEGPGVYLYFEIQSLKIVDRIIKFIKRHVDANNAPISGREEESRVHLEVPGQRPAGLPPHLPLAPEDLREH